MNTWGIWLSTRSTAWLAGALLWAALAHSAAAGPASWPVDAADQAQLPAAWLQQIDGLVKAGLETPTGARVTVITGKPPAQLKLAPCEKAEPYLPAQARRWGNGRVGLRCLTGARWNLYLPIHVQVHAPALVLTQGLPAGAEITAEHLKLAEVDIAAAPSPTFDRPAQLIGRRLAAPLAQGAEVRANDLRAHQWFAAGDPVTLVALGSGFAIEGEGQALTPGLEGQSVRVRTPSGRVVVGTPNGERRVEVPL
jgi:flagella basal body P-ring formation protein FlgA